MEMPLLRCSRASIAGWATSLHHVPCRWWAQWWLWFGSSWAVAAHLGSARQTAALILSTCPCAAASALAAAAGGTPEPAKSQRRATPDSPERNVPAPNRDGGFSQQPVSPARLLAVGGCPQLPSPWGSAALCNPGSAPAAGKASGRWLGARGGKRWGAALGGFKPAVLLRHAPRAGLLLPSARPWSLPLARMQNRSASGEPGPGGS